MPTTHANWLWVGTVVSMVVGIALALIRGRQVLAASDAGDRRLVLREKVALASLGALYAAVAVIPILDSHRLASVP